MEFSNISQLHLTSSIFVLLYAQFTRVF